MMKQIWLPQFSQSDAKDPQYLYLNLGYSAQITRSDPISRQALKLLHFVSTGFTDLPEHPSSKQQGLGEIEARL